MSTARRRAVRALVAASGAACVLALAIAVFGSLTLPLGASVLRARRPEPLVVAAVVLAGLAMLAGRGSLREALGWWWGAIERHAAAAALVLAAAAVFTGMTWGTFAAGGSDSYCYLNQAELFARGRVADMEPLARDPAWPGDAAAFVPAGHNPSPGEPGTFVPICPAGYPVLLAGARAVAGRPGMFWVTPLFGGLLVWLAFLIGRRTAGPAAGLLAALFTASSPIVLYQIVQPMNDVPAAATWAAALTLALGARGGPLSTGLAAGALTGIAITIRPNLVPLAGVVGMAAACWPKGAPIRSRVLTLVAFGVATLPGIALVMGIQQAMHGSPLRSGYGDLSSLFSTSHVWPNFVQYSRWVVGAHTPVILLALAAPPALRGEARRAAAWLLAFAAATLACYLPYVVFDAWWYQRFLLPAIPPLLVLVSALAARALMPLPPALRTVVFVSLAAAVATVFVHTAVQRGVFGLWHFEGRFRTAGQYVAQLPADAVVITTHHSGSVRFYAGRSTAAWDGIAPGRLSEALAFMRARGRRPYILVEDWELRAFRERFAGDPLGGLEWPHMAEIDRHVRIYDPADYDRYMRGERIRTERVMTR